MYSGSPRGRLARRPTRYHDVARPGWVISGATALMLFAVPSRLVCTTCCQRSGEPPVMLDWSAIPALVTSTSMRVFKGDLTDRLLN